MKMISLVAPVPPRYRGVWQRTLLKTDALEDTDTLVLWLQTTRWHADIRIPATRGDFTGVMSLAACNPAQQESLAQQQGFAGVTQIDVAQHDARQSDAEKADDICHWHRLTDYQPPASVPDVGAMHFDGPLLIELGVCADYLEHWIRLPGSDRGFLALRRQEGDALRLLLMAGDYVMHVRGRATQFSPDLPLDRHLSDFDNAAWMDLLDFEIAFGMRTEAGWQVRHATLPWLEGREIAVCIHREGDQVVLDWDGEESIWQIEEWQTP